MAEVQPRQIVYPFESFIRFGRSAAASECKFVETLSDHLDSERRVLPLGRARAGIYLLAAKVIAGERRRILMSPYTIPDVVNMVRLAGATPVFFDFAPNSTNVSPESVSAALDERTAAVMLTHYHVNQRRLTEIGALCAAQGVKLFDDCAIAFGSRYRNAPIGALTDASVMSFSAFKLMNFLWGGALAVKSDALFDAIEGDVNAWPKLRLLQYRRQALKILVYRLATSRAAFPLFFRLRRSLAAGEQVRDVFPLSRIETVSLDDSIRSRPHDIALLEWVRKFALLQRRIEQRQRTAAIYDQYLRPLSVSGETEDDIRLESGFINYPVTVGKRRDEIYRTMLESGFDVGRSLYPNVHEVEGYTGIEGVSGNVSQLVRSVLTLPTHSRIREEYAHRLARRLAEAL